MGCPELSYKPSLSIAYKNESLKKSSDSKFFISQKVSSNNYYPFGMTMKQAGNVDEDYKYGFNGMEKDDEVSGSGNSYDFGARTYDPRIGRFRSMDPLALKYPEISPYAALNNSPLNFVDPDGRENVPALVWATKNMANKGIPFDVWYGGKGGWSYKPGKVPTETVCYESCWTAYMNGANSSTMSNLKTGFSTKSGGFKGRSHDTGGMNWFKGGDGTDRKFESDISKGELGDIVFMGEVGDMAGHAVLLAGDITKGSTTFDGKTVETMTFNTLSTSSDSDSGNYGSREFSFYKVDGKWQKDGDGYEFQGFGQMKNIGSTDQEKKDAKDGVDKLKTP